MILFVLLFVCVNVHYAKQVSSCQCCNVKKDKHFVTVVKYDFHIRTSFSTFLTTFTFTPLHFLNKMCHFIPINCT